MLLTNLHETISRRAKTKEELQKLIDISGSTGIEALTNSTVRFIDDEVILKNIITPGTLPFKFDWPTGSDLIKKLAINLPTLRSLKGSGLESVEVNSLFLGTLINEGKMQSIEGAPLVRERFNIVKQSKLKDLVGFHSSNKDVILIIQDCPSIKTLVACNGAKSITILGSSDVSFQQFPDSCDALNVETTTLTQKLPWFVTIPSRVKVYPPIYSDSWNSIPNEIRSKMISYQKKGGTRANVLEIQADLIDADLDRLAEL